MHPDDLMNPDLLSEIVMLVCGIAIFAPMLLILIVAITHTAAL
jgi:hypothetical protein